MAAALELRNISKSFNHTPVISKLGFILQAGQIGCLLGASGCGKTTALRTIAGFESPDTGQILINERIVATPDAGVPPEKRRIGMVFQDYALFPHLSVQENVLFGLKGIDGIEKKQRAAELMEMVGLAEYARNYPHELSGGQQQRVALAPRPEILLMDEPFSNLDVALRERLSMEVRDILKSFSMSAVMVTHNQNEAFAMADVIGVMQNGRLEQWDSAYNLYHRPASRAVANFVGEGVLLNARVLDQNKVETGLGVLEGRFAFACRNGCPAHVLIRPEDVVHDHDSSFKARIINKNFRGANILYTLLLPSDEKVLALVPSHHNHRLGQKIGIIPEVDDIILFEQSSP